MKYIQIITLLFFSMCSAQNIGGEDIDREIGRFNANGFSETSSERDTKIADSIRASDVTQAVDLKNTYRSDYKPDSGLFFKDELQSAEKESFTKKNHNIEEASNTPQAENSTNESISPNYYEETKSLSLIDKIIRIVGLVIGWFVVGFLINYLFYAGKPDYLVGKSEIAKNVHILINIITGVLIFMTLFTS
jgi:hypothetical protein